MRYGVRDSLSVRVLAQSATCRRGLFATEPISEGTLVGVYECRGVGGPGKVYQTVQKFTNVGPHRKQYFVLARSNLYIDSKMKGNFVKFANGSAPNGSNCRVMRCLVPTLSTVTKIRCVNMYAYMLTVPL